MTQQPDMSEMDEYYERTRKPLFKVPNNRLGRLGCGLLVTLWFMLLLLPCAMIWLALGNNITISHANSPEPEQHPLFEIQLIMEQDNRGLKFTNSTVQEDDDQNLCVDINVNYLLWESDSSAVPSAFCQCYQREADSEQWQFTQQFENVCANP